MSTDSTQTVQQSAENQTQESSTKSKDKELNFAALRRQKEQAEHELQQERDRRTALEAQIEANKAQAISTQHPSQDDEDDLDDNEPYVDKKSLKRHLRKFERINDEKITRKAEEIAQKLLADERKAYQEIRLKSEMPDFEHVVTEESAQRLSEKYPDLAKRILKVADENLRKELAYQTIKDLSLHKKEEPKSNVQEQIAAKQRVPYYYPSNIASPPATSTDFSETGKKNAYEKMQSLIKNRRG